MPSTITTNMGLIVPTVGQEPGPAWANDLNASLTTIDQHNHSTGQGVQINPNGMNINADLPINSNNLTSVKTVRFSSQGTFIPGTTPNLGCIYVAGNELYYNDEAGNVVPITLNGSVNAGGGSISGLPSGTASASYSAGPGTFVWRSATNTGANMDNASVTIREQVASANGVTLKSPTSLAANYNLIFPAALPGGTSFLTLDTAGNIGDTVAYPLQNSGLATNSVNTTQLVDQSVTEAKLAPRPINNPAAAGEIAISTSSLTASTASTTFLDVNFMSHVTITSTGRPIRLALQPDDSGNEAYILPTAVTGGAVRFFRVTDSQGLGTTSLGAGGGSAVVAYPPSSMEFIDNPGAGTWEYAMQYRTNNASFAIQLFYSFLVAYEI